MDALHVPRHCGTKTIQDLSYRKQISCAQNMLSLKSMLKVTGNGTIGQIIHDLLLVELFDVEYYCDLEMC